MSKESIANRGAKPETIEPSRKAHGATAIPPKPCDRSATKVAREPVAEDSWIRRLEAMDLLFDTNTSGTLH